VLAKASIARHGQRAGLPDPADDGFAGVVLLAG